ncbi:MAG: hypothetical protein RIB77_38605 [Sandaracinaceae bacterium]
MSPPSIHAAATYGVTVRCAFRKLFLTPFAPELHEGILYALAAAQRKTGALLHQITIEPNHMHDTVTTTKANLPDFKRLFHGEVSKFVKVFLKEHGFEPPARVFGDGRSHHMRLVNSAAQLVYLHYSDGQVVKDGLTRTVDEYPGFVSDPAMMKGTVIRVARPALYFDPRTTEPIEELRFSMPPLLQRELGADRVVEHLERARRSMEQAHAKERKFPVLGAERLMKQHPWAEPASPRKRNPGPIPSFRVIDDDELEEHCAKETEFFRDAHEKARRARAKGDHEVEFPAGTYLMKVQHGASVASPDNESVLAADEVFEAPRARLSSDALRALSEKLRGYAATVDPEQQADALGARILAGDSLSVTQKQSPRVETGGDETTKRLVTLRGTRKASARTDSPPRPEPPRDDDPSASARDERDPGEPPDEPGDK